MKPSCSLEFFISNARWINARQTPLASQVEVLAAAIRSDLDQPPVPPTVTFAVAPSPTHIPANRLLTLAGHGGSGNTRLSLEVAVRILAEGSLVPGGVFFVSLDSVTTPQQIPFAIAQALDLAFAGQCDAQELLLAFLAPKQLWLVLDNFEHLLDGAELVSDILTAAPMVKILATSREA